MSSQYRSAAMWLAMDWSEVQAAIAPAGITDPHHLRQWCKEQGFDDMHRNDRSDAMWLADNWSLLQHGDATLTHPRRIREEFNEQKVTSVLPA
ncbi:hypothetical protein ACKVEX_09040 [Rhodocyclaceae bacterium SMB388]